MQSVGTIKNIKNVETMRCIYLFHPLPPSFTLFFISEDISLRKRYEICLEISIPFVFFRYSIFGGSLNNFSVFYSKFQFLDTYLGEDQNIFTKIQRTTQKKSNYFIQLVVQQRKK